jgi:hypothetical protein
MAGFVTTLAGVPFASGVVDGVGREARFYTPQGVAAGPGGRLYLTDSSGQTIRTVGWARLTLSPTALRFGATRMAGGGVESVTSPQTVVVSAASPSAQWRVSSSHPWVRVTGGNGTGVGAFTVSIDPALVPAAGVELATNLTVTLLADNLTTSATVWLTVRPTTTTTAAPVGSFDTPIHGAAGAQGSIAVTGWAVDDIDVRRVEIWRDLAPGETTPPFDGPGHPAHGKVFIANAAFLAGARPDVEAAYWDWPHAQQAGWGYMLLTWGLWAQGNGTYTLHALAYDPEGHITSLGAKTIAVNNQRATKPFGAIDTPTLGGTASGPSFVNFGWALTPPSNAADPRHCVIDDGGVLVSVDSGPLVPVTYGSLRPDVQAAFPAFGNAAGAGGHYVIDASTLTNGVHTIGWLVTDSCGRTDGMGSRFFTVAGGASGSGQTAALSGTASNDGLSQLQQPDAADAARVGMVMVRRSLGQPEPAPSTVDGRIVVGVGQGDRIELEVGPNRRGHHLVQGHRRDLPVGSSYDASRGIFYWQPFEAFLGAYDLEFSPALPSGRLADDPAGSDSASTVRVRVVVGPPMRMAIDVPRPGDVVSPSFRLAGWALDLASLEGSGVDTVHVWAYPVSGGHPIFLGLPVVGVGRPDVSAVYGGAFPSGGYDLQTAALPAGDYDVVVYAHRAATNGFEAAHVVRVGVK